MPLPGIDMEVVVPQPVDMDVATTTNAVEMDDATIQPHTHDDRYYTKGQTDDLLDEKSDVGHTHDDRYYTESETDSKLAEKAPLVHNHDDRYYTESETDSKLAQKAPLVHNHDDRYSQLSHNHDERYYTESETDDLLDEKSDVGHIHDDRYYTESETDSKLAQKAPLNHNHDDRYYTETETDSKLAQKAPLAHNHDDRYYTESETDSKLAQKAPLVHNHDDRYYTESETNTLLATKSPLNHNHDDRYYTETETDTLLAGKQNVIDSAHKLSADLVSDGSTNKVVTQTEKNAWNGKQPAGNYMTLDTDQTATSKKTLSYTEPLVRGGQETILNVLSTHTNDEMESMWAGRMKIGNMNKTFMLGVYRQLLLGQPAICGIGAHSWENSFNETGAAWEDIYLNPDGNKTVYIGDHDWREGTGWFKVQNSGTDYNGKTYCNRGSITSPTWREVATVNDGSLYATNETWSASKLNTQFSGKEATANKVTSISSSSTNTQYPSAKCVYDAIFGAMEASY